MRIVPRVDDRRPPLPDILAAAGRGEQWAVDDLAAQCLPKLTSFAEARGAVDPGGVADLVMVEFLRRLGPDKSGTVSFDGPSQMWAYLYRIARSRVIDERRATKPIELRDGPEIESLVAPSPEFSEEVADRDFVDGLLAGLTIDQREVLELRFLDDLSIEETASRTGRTLTAVKGLQRRAMRALSAAALVAVILIIAGVLYSVLRDDGAVTFISEEPASEPPNEVLEVDTNTGDDESSDGDGSTSVVGGPVTDVDESLAPSTAIVGTERSDDDPRAITFRFAGTGELSGVAGFACRLDLGDWTECSSPQTYRDLANGSHVFEVRAIDRSGNSDPSPAYDAWAVVVESRDGVPDGVDLAALRSSTTVLRCLGMKGTFAELEAKGFDVMVGTAGDDVIDVSAGDKPDLVIGNGGNDTIITGKGDDRVCAGDGNDTIETGDGRDRIAAGGGNDTILAGGGDDQVWAGGGHDSVQGGGGNDVLRGEGGLDILEGQDGDDKLNGGDGLDVLAGQGGNDLCEDPDPGIPTGESGCEEPPAEVTTTTTAEAPKETTETTSN